MEQQITDADVADAVNVAMHRYLAERPRLEAIVVPQEQRAAELRQHRRWACAAGILQAWHTRDRCSATQSPTFIRDDVQAALRWSDALLAESERVPMPAAFVGAPDREAARAEDARDADRDLRREERYR